MWRSLSADELFLAREQTQGMLRGLLMPASVMVNIAGEESRLEVDSLVRACLLESLQDADDQIADALLDEREPWDG